MKIAYKHEIKHGEKLSESDLIEIILKNRQIKDRVEFLTPTHPSRINLTDFGPPAGGLKKTLKLLEKIKKNKETVVVYTDYDADGITGGAILWETLHLLGFKAMPYVPHRKKEGYGFSIKGIDNVKKQFNPALIISVDHGITAKEKVSYAKKIGIPIVITDHHLKPDALPDDAEAIFHITELSGSGVAYFFAKAIFSHFHDETAGRNPEVAECAEGEGKTSGVKVDWQRIKDNFSSDYLSLASIGTIADMVPLLGPSRSIAKYGLDAFSKTKRCGLQEIISEAGITGRKITPYEIGFIIAPRINAVGRLEHAIDALRLLCTTRDDKAYDLASRVGEKNRERQDLVTKAVEEAKRLVSNQHSVIGKIPKIIILKNSKFHEGIIGLIASKIAEEYYRPTIVLTESDGFLKGSARSIPSFHITNFLRGLKKYLIDVGGHKGAAGFTMEKKNYTIFAAGASKMVSKLISEKDLERIIEADLKLPISKLNIPLVRGLEKLEPFGIGNPRPTFYSEVEILHSKTFGKKNDHLKLIVRDVPSKLPTAHFQLPIELITFGNANKYASLAGGQRINVVYSIEIDRWGGSEKLRGKINIINYPEDLPPCIKEL